MALTQITPDLHGAPRPCAGPQHRVCLGGSARIFTQQKEHFSEQL